MTVKGRREKKPIVVSKSVARRLAVQMTTPRERAERALQHAPFMGMGKEAVLPLVEREIIDAQQAERERCAVKCDELAEQYATDGEPHLGNRSFTAKNCAGAIRNQEPAN